MEDNFMCYMKDTCAVLCSSCHIVYDCSNCLNDKTELCKTCEYNSERDSEQ